MNNYKTQPIASHKQGLFYGYIVVGITFLIMLFTWGAFGAFGLFFQPLLSGFNSTSAIISGVSSVSLLFYGAFGILMGIINDKVGPRIVLTICGLLIGAGYLLMSQATNIWQLYIYYAIIGAGMGGSWVPVLSCIAKWFVKRRSLMSGIGITGIGVGQIICPPVVSRLIATYDWRLSYIIMGSFILIVIVIASQFLKSDPARMGQKAYGAGEVESEKSNLKKTRVEMRSYTLKEATRTTQFWIMMVMVFGFGFASNTIVVHIVPHAGGLGISAITAANILAVIGGIGIFGNNIMGTIGDRIGNKWIYVIGFIAMAGTLFWLVSIRDLWMFYVFAVIFGFANGGVATVESALIAGLFGLRWHGVIFGVIHSAWTIGAAVGPVIAGYLVDRTGSYQNSFLLGGLIGIVGLITSLLLRPTKNTKTISETFY
jgi:MFS family permease